jgi:hypothetical protein
VHGEASSRSPHLEQEAIHRIAGLSMRSRLCGVPISQRVSTEAKLGALGKMGEEIRMRLRVRDRERPVR